jgi:hypothetical protein
MMDNLSPLEMLASIICESGGARFVKIERVKGCVALVLFCAQSAQPELQTPIALPITELSTRTVGQALLGARCNPEVL